MANAFEQATGLCPKHELQYHAAHAGQSAGKQYLSHVLRHSTHKTQASPRTRAPRTCCSCRAKCRQTILEPRAQTLHTQDTGLTQNTSSKIMLLMQIPNTHSMRVDRTSTALRATPTWCVCMCMCVCLCVCACVCVCVSVIAQA
jgi:hypothetical protein